MTRRVNLLIGVTALTLLLGGQVMGGWPGGSATQAAAGLTLAPSSAPPATIARPTTGAPATTPVVPRPSTRPAVPPPSRRAATAAGKGASLTAVGVRRSTGSQAVALTYDDGPDPSWTPQVLAVLRGNGVKATFCVIGTQARKYPYLIRQIAREGHTLCNHSWNHEFKLGTWSPAAIRSNLARTNAEIRRAVPGARIPYFRHPGGNFTPAAVKGARALGMVSIGWSVDPQDWRKPSAAVIAARVLNTTRAGGVILLHDGGGDRSRTVAASRKIVPALKKRYRLIRLP